MLTNKRKCDIIILEREVNNMKLNEHDKQEIKNLIAFRKAYKDWIKLSEEERIKKFINSFRKDIDKTYK